MQKRELRFFELLEKLIPIERSQSIFSPVTGKIDSQQTGRLGAALCSFNRGGRAAARFDPFPDLVVINGDIALLTACSSRTLLRAARAL